MFLMHVPYHELARFWTFLFAENTPSLEKVEPTTAQDSSDQVNNKVADETLVKPTLGAAKPTRGSRSTDAPPQNTIADSSEASTSMSTTATEENPTSPDGDVGAPTAATDFESMPSTPERTSASSDHLNNVSSSGDVEQKSDRVDDSEDTSVAKSDSVASEESTSKKASKHSNGVEKSVSSTLRDDEAKSETPTGSPETMEASDDEQSDEGFYDDKENIEPNEGDDSEAAENQMPSEAEVRCLHRHNTIHSKARITCSKVYENATYYRLIVKGTRVPRNS